LVTVDLDEVRHKPMPARSSGGDPAITGVVATLKTRIEALQAELAKLEAAAAGHRADFERERDRAALLVSELLAATADMMEAKETAAKLEGELVALRSLLKPAPLSWWRWLRTAPRWERPMRRGRQGLPVPCYPISVPIPRSAATPTMTLASSSAVWTDAEP